MIYWPDICPYVLTTFITYSYSRGSVLQKKKLSSAKRKWDTEGHARVTRIHVIFPWFSFQDTLQEKMVLIAHRDSADFQTAMIDNFFDSGTYS